MVPERGIEDCDFQCPSSNIYERMSFRLTLRSLFSILYSLLSFYCPVDPCSSFRFMCVRKKIKPPVFEINDKDGREPLAARY